MTKSMKSKGAGSMTEYGLEHSGRPSLASEILRRLGVAVYSEWPQGWLRVQSGTLRAMMEVVEDELPKRSRLNHLTRLHGRDGSAVFMPEDQDQLGFDANVAFIVPDTEAVKDGPERPMGRFGVMRLVTSRHEGDSKDT